MSEIQPDAAASPGDIAWRLRRQDLPGWWGKRLAIQPQHVAVARWPGGTEVLDPQTFDFGAPGGRPAPEDLLLVFVGPLDLSLRLADLLSSDGQLVTADGRLRCRIAKPMQLSQAWPAGRERIDGAALAELAAAALKPGAAALARGRSAEALCQPVASAALAGELRALATDALAGLGLAVEGLHAVSWTPAAEALRQDEAREALKGALQQQKYRALLAAASSKADMERAVRQIAHELNLENAMREQELIDVAGAEWAARQGAAGAAAGSAVADPAGTAGVADTVGSASGTAPSAGTAAAEEPLSTLDQLCNRLARLIERMGSAPAVAKVDPWSRIKAILDVVGAGIGATAAIAGRQLSDLLTDMGLPDAWAPWIRMAAAAVTLVLVWRTYDRFRPGPARQTPPSGGGAPPALPLPSDRRLAEELVRKHVAAALLRVQADLTRAVDAAYRAGADVATPLRLLRAEAAGLSKELAYALAQSRHSAYMGGQNLQPRLLQDMLDNEEALLALAERLESLSRRLYDGVVDGDFPGLASPRRDLDKALRETHDRLIRRTAILAG